MITFACPTELRPSHLILLGNHLERDDQTRFYPPEQYFRGIYHQA
nr:MAG TPA: hypothetical protein [Caudoviricetes sp.]